MAGLDERRTKSLFIERFGEEPEEGEPEVRSNQVGDIPLKLTDHRFEAEDTRLRRFDTVLDSSRTAERSATARGGLDSAPIARDTPRPGVPTQSWREPKATETAPEPTYCPPQPTSPSPARAAEVSRAHDPRAAVISHSHQKLHRSFLDADLRAEYGATPPKTATRPATVSPSASSRNLGRNLGLKRAVLLLSLLVVAMTGYGYLAMRQNNIPPRQLPGVQPVLKLMRGPTGEGLKRIGRSLEAAGDRAAGLVAASAARVDNWWKNR